MPVADSEGIVSCMDRRRDATRVFRGQSDSTLTVSLARALQQNSTGDVTLCIPVRKCNTRSRNPVCIQQQEVTSTNSTWCAKRENRFSCKKNADKARMAYRTRYPAARRCAWYMYPAYSSTMQILYDPNSRSQAVYY
eukprot:1211899-Rhodomonas_salina.1